MRDLKYRYFFYYKKVLIKKAVDTDRIIVKNDFHQHINTYASKNVIYVFFLCVFTATEWSMFGG